VVLEEAVVGEVASDEGEMGVSTRAPEEAVVGEVVSDEGEMTSVEGETTVEGETAGCGPREAVSLEAVVGMNALHVRGPRNQGGSQWKRKQHGSSSS